MNPRARACLFSWAIMGLTDEEELMGKTSRGSWARMEPSELKKGELEEMFHHGEGRGSSKERAGFMVFTDNITTPL